MSPSVYVKRGYNQNSAHKGVPRSDEGKANIREAIRKSFAEGRVPSFTGMKHSKESKTKMSNSRKGQFLGKMNPMYGVRLTKDKNGNWKGGITPLMASIRTMDKYLDWRIKIFTRDNYTCRECNDSIGGNLEAHHIKKLAKIIREKAILTIEDAQVCKELWDINNGKTLCQECHKNTDNFGNRIN